MSEKLEGKRERGPTQQSLREGPGKVPVVEDPSNNKYFSKGGKGERKRGEGKRAGG